MRIASKGLLGILRWLLITSLAGLIVGTGVVVHVKLASKTHKPKRKIMSKYIPLVRVKILKSESVRLSFSGFGRVRPAKKVTLFAQVSGRVIKVSPWLKAGEFVSKGEALVIIDPTDYLLAKQNAFAKLDSAKAQLARLRRELENLDSQIDIVKENTKLAKGTLNRTMKLFKGGVTSETKRDQDRQAYLELSNKLIDLENGKTLLPIQIDEARANAQARKIDLQRTKIDLRRTTVQAPFAARVKSVATEIGAIASPSSQLAVLEGSGMAEVAVIVPENELADLFDSPDYRTAMWQDRAGFRYDRFLRKERRLSAVINYRYGAKKYNRVGRVRRLEPLVEKKRIIPVVVEVQNPWGWSGENYCPPLEYGKFVTAKLYGQTLTGVYSVPRSAMRENGTLLVVRDGLLVICKVHVRYRMGQRLIIDKGVSDGDSVIVSTLSSPVPGMRVRIEAAR